MKCPLCDRENRDEALFCDTCGAALDSTIARHIDVPTLRSVVQRRHTLPPEDAISIVVEICRAVAHAHSKGIIHRDLKPENVMIDTEGDVFVLDFGLARTMEDQGLTRAGAILG